MKKGGFLRNVLDTIRSNQAASPSGRGSHGGSNERAIEFGGQLKPSHFSLCQVARHGFPEHPTSLAFDPVQKIAAIGTKSGAIRIFGRPGVDVWAQHEPAFAVTHMKFIINQGAIITVTADESIHLWSLRGPNLRLIFSSSTQGVSGSSPQASSPAPTPASNISSVSPQSGSSIVTGGVAGVASAATSSSSFLGQITDTVTGAVDSASDFLSGGAAGEHQTTPSPTSDARHTVSRKPEILHTLKFQREHITYIHQTLTSKWLYIGTERGNVHVANVETFELSGYSIAWNKAIELSRKTHPGSIIHISECPQDTNKLLIGYESGCIVIWDLKQRNADGRYYYTENLLWLAWHYEGKQFVAAHGDGSLITWQTRSNTRPAQVLHPHAKTNSTSDPGSLQHQQSITSSFARSLNNELYRPINKVEWKTSKSTGEPFYLFSGGLPYDGFDQAPLAAATLDHNRPTAASVSLSQRQAAASAISSSQQLLKASSASPGCIPATSPVSPNWQQDPSPGGSKISASSDPRQSKTSSQHKEKKCLRSTSLTVMYGKSITVLEMDDTIIDFITVCDNSPYENDTSDPYAVIVLLSNELILIDLTSSGYPSFDSPYPSANLNESPVTCVQYLADCSSDLIPFLYSTSQNVISRAPKKGFSDKEWPINGGEWGQSMQSYPELVLTGHADGTIKFWDMSGVNFDLISKIKTSKLFEKPNKPPNAILLAVSNNSGAGALTRRSPKPHSPSIVSLSETDHQSAGPTNDQHESSRQVFEEDLFAIEKIEFCSTTKRLLVAGACAQVIQFRLNKKDPHSGNSANFSELTTIMVEPTNCMEPNPSATGASASNKWKQHCLLQVKASQGGGASSSSGGSSSSSSSHRGRGLSGFQAELVCLTPLLISTNPPPTTDDNQPSLTHTIYCQAPPRITALAFQPTHNILAYAHEFGIVLIDLIQKCVIINATLNDLSGGSLINASNRDISIQPYATSSILQHHYQANTPSASTVAFATGNEFSSRVSPNNQSNNGSADSQQYNRTDLADNGSAGPTATTDTTQAKSSSGLPDGGQIVSPSRTALSSSKQPVQSRYTNTMFQRQLSTNALNINAPPTSASSTSSSSATTKQGPRLFHRQMTASQLFTGGNSSSTSCQQDNSNMKRLLASSRADANLASSAVCLATASNQAIAAAAAASSGSRMKPGDCPSDQAPAKKTAKNKRIISRMLSISAIHTTVGSGSASSGGSGSGSVPATETSGLLSHNANNTGLSGGCLSDDTNQSNDATPIGGIDKFDSSFRRSRSSSTSSTTGHFQQQQQLQQQQQHNQNEPNQQQQLASESILCIAFLDPAQVAQSGGPHSASAAGVGAGSGTSQASASATNMTNSSSQAGQAGSSSSSSAAVAPGQVQSSAGLNHKSLSSIDNQQSGQLALWLGTSAGSVLLVCLQMPDNEDNRILQLQSISAEPIPRASIKLSGQILCIAPFTCEARLQPLGAAGLSGSAGAGNSQMSSSSGIQSASQSSSLEGDTHMQSPGSSASSCSASGGGALTGCPSGGAPAGSGGVSVAPSGGVSSSRTAAALDSPANVSFDSRSSLFIAIVGEKEARVYQVPPPGAAGSSSSSSRTAAGADHHHVSSHHHGHSSTQLPQQLQDSPLGNLLTNKRNLMATCELSDTSFACRSSVVQMRSPDESCLVSYLATGNIVVHSLPRLRPILMDADFVPYSSPRISSSMCMSRQGHCLYQPSVGEICKFTVSAQYKALVNEMIGLVYVPREMPEMPRTNFFKSLFSVSQSSRQSDRDELFGECSAGKPSRGVAKHIGTGAGPAGGPNSTVSGLDKLKGAAVGTMGHDVRMAREGLDERGEKLSEIEDRTLNMMNQSETYSQAAHQLAQKFKDKKWYQF